MKGAWNESSKGFSPGANMAPVRSSASRRYAPAHAPCRIGMEVRLRMVHARHRYPSGGRGGARGTRDPVPVWRSASRGYGVLPPDDAMRHRSLAWRESSRRSAPAARVLLVLHGINNIRKQRGYRCRFVVSSLGASTCNYRGVMRFFRGAHDPEWEAGNYLIAALVSVRMSTEDVQTFSRYNLSFDQLVHSYGVFFAALSDVASNSSRGTHRALDMREGVDPVELLFEYSTQ